MDNLPNFKGQPWIVFDTIASTSFLLGDTDRPAFGTNQPAITRAGEMIFFAAGRRRAQVPWYTNMDVDGLLSYGMRVWGMYLLFGFPTTPQVFTDEPEQTTSDAPQLTYGAVLAQAIVDFGVVELLLGQEPQMDFPVSRFGAGGGLAVGGNHSLASVQNSIPRKANVMKFPESIDCSRTLNIDVKIRLAPEILATIGTPVDPGVGCPLNPGSYVLDIVGVSGQPSTINLDWPPYLLQCGLIGERIKDTQYGQLPPGAQRG